MSTRIRQPCSCVGLCVSRLLGYVREAYIAACSAQVLILMHSAPSLFPTRFPTCRAGLRWYKRSLLSWPGIVPKTARSSTEGITVMMTVILMILVLGYSP